MPPRADPFERHEQRVGGRVQVGVAPRPPVREHRVVDRVPALQLRPFERVERAGRVGSQRELRARQVARRPQERQRELAARTVRGVDDLVLEEPVVQQREALLAVGAVDEATRHERRQADLVRAALRGEPAVHDGERALGVGAVDRRGQREVGAETVVAAAVVELGVDPQEPLAGAQLERGADLDELGLVAPAGCTSARRPRRGGAARTSRRRASRARTGPALGRLDAHRRRAVDDRVVVGRRVVVRVAAVAAVDQPVAAGHDDAVAGGDRERAVVGVDRDAQVLVLQRARRRRAAPSSVRRPRPR